MSKVSDAILEITDDLRGVTISHDVANKITMKILGGRAPLASLSGHEIRAIREKANVSQAVFASLLNIGTGYLSELERGVKPAKGATLALLYLVRRVGVQSLMDETTPAEI
jgi:putative transcriptional regulator